MSSRRCPSVATILALLAFVLFSPRVPFAAADTQTVTFRCEAPGAHQVFLAGTFNNWSSDQLPMNDPDGDGVFEASLPLEPGTYQYKFVVDGTWREDPKNDQTVPDGYGGKNSVLVVGEAGAAATPAAPAQAAAPAMPAGSAAPAAAAAAGPPIVKPADAEGRYPVTFRYAAPGAHQVFLAGTFNNWAPDQTAMSDKDGDGVFEVTQSLEAGSYLYKFVVDGQWHEDPSVSETVDDGYGGQNSVLKVGPTAVPLEGLREVPFSYRAPAGARDVFLAGTFNDWAPATTRMTDPDGDGVFDVTLLLSPGTYQYKFVADGQWHEDPNGKAFTDDGYGGKNTILEVGESFKPVKIAKGDGQILTRDLRHVQRLPDLNPFEEGRVALQARAFAGDVEGVSLVTWTGGKEARTPMDLVGEENGLALFRTTLSLEGPGEQARYVFAYRDGSTTKYLTPDGFADAADSAQAFRYKNGDLPVFSVPSWVGEGVIYQIFPDRFCNGDTSNDQKFTEPYYEGARSLPHGGKTNGEYFHFVHDWTDVSGLQHSPYRTDGKPDWYSFYGGDLRGVIDKIPYLADLGVTAIYFNPIFEARSNHKYDAIDYTRVDPHFGSDADFEELVAKAHAAGIHIILDIVYNHCGDWHPAFRDVVVNGPKAEHWSWFEWKKWPLPSGTPGVDYKPSDYYACWWGIGSLPDFNYDLSRPNPDENAVSDIAQAQPNQPVIDYLLGATKQWVERGADGFRLDVPNEVPPWFWNEFRRTVRSVNPDVYIVGEIWGDATSWLGPTCFDAVMNYRYFRDPVLKFLVEGKGDAAAFDRDLRPGRLIYPPQAAAAMMNLVGSHDTDRVRSVGHGDARRSMLAATFAMTYPGAPHVYYGDEIGMESANKDPDSRRPFVWTWSGNPERAAIHEHYKRMIALRKGHAALRSGTFTTLATAGRVYSYQRAGGGERFVVALNAGDAPAEVSVAPDPAPADGTTFANVVSGAKVQVTGGKLAIRLEPLEGVVLAEQGTNAVGGGR